MVTPIICALPRLPQILLLSLPGCVRAFSSNSWCQRVFWGTAFWGLERALRVHTLLGVNLSPEWLLANDERLAPVPPVSTN